jgi:predicted house-cleaning noncanonical NTP pyrophosphatase (MazG superfamily)
MEKTMLWEAYSSLNPAELREFDKFVRSPFFNSRPHIIELQESLSKYMEKGEVPPKTPNKVSERLAQSALLTLLEKYLIYKEKFADPERGKIRLAAAYRKRNLPKHFQITMREARLGCEKQPHRHADYYHDLNLLEWEQYQFDTSSHRTESLNIQSTSDLMDQAFIARKMRLACLALAHQAVYKTEYKVGLLEEVLEYIETENLQEKPAIGLYFHCFHFLTQSYEEAKIHFEKFRTMLALSVSHFPSEELRALYLLTINFGIKKLNESRGEWLQITFDLYKSALELGLLVEHNQISRFAFNNIVAIALRAGALDWAEAFILNYRPKLERQWRDATASLNSARVAYARKDHSTALLNLQRSDYKDLINNLIAKTLQLKIYYEMNEFSLLSSHLASMRNFIRRHTAIGYHRTNYSHLLQYTKQLMGLNLTDVEAVKQFRERLEQEKILTEKEWFYEMLEQ